MRPRKALLALLLILNSAPTSAIPPSSGPDSARSLVVVKSRDLAPYNQAARGLRRSLQAWEPSLHIQELELPALDARERPFLEALQKSRPDLIVTIGTQATRSVMRRIQDIPVVFSLVLTAGDSELRLQPRAPNVTGAAMDVPVALQFARMKEVIAGLQRVGVLYNPRESGRVIEEARTAAAVAGLSLVEFPVTSEAQVMREAGDLKGRVDALWSVADSTVFTPRSVDYILLLTLRDGIPFVGLSPSFVKAGALLSFSCDYEDVGMQSGELAVEILKGRSPAELPVLYPRQVSLSLNLNTARAIRLKISEKIQAESQVHHKP